MNILFTIKCNKSKDEISIVTRFKLTVMRRKSTLITSEVVLIYIITNKREGEGEGRNEGGRKVFWPQESVNMF